MDDTISRQATIEALWAERQELDAEMQRCLENNMPLSRADAKTRRTRIEDDIEIIKDLPAVPAKEGKWIFPYGNKKYKRCSICDGEFYSIPSTTMFCPNCGAKMNKGKANEGKKTNRPPKWDEEMIVFHVYGDCDAGPKCPWRGGHGIDRCHWGGENYKHCDPDIRVEKFTPKYPKDCYPTIEEALEKLDQLLKEAKGDE